MGNITTIKDLEALTSLGKSGAEYTGLETFPSHSAPGSIEVVLDCAEFTCICPLTKQPDWAIIRINYQPDNKILETKSLKLYLEQYRDTGIFHEHLAQTILDDMVSALEPLRCRVTVKFNSRGGIAVSASAHYGQE